MADTADSCAIIVTWQPDIAVLTALVAGLVEQGCTWLVVDNGSDNPAGIRDALSSYRRPSLGLDCLPANIGLAGALNRGLQQASDAGFSHTFLFDQDSAIGPGFCAAMLQAREEAGALLDRPLAALGPRLRDPDTGRQTSFRVFDRWLFRSDRPLAPGEPHYEAGFLITSGTLLVMDALQDIGQMREDYFIDNVDLEWCFRAQSRGYAVAGTDRAVLFHRIGEPDNRWLVRRGWLVQHSPQRSYYSTRNRLNLYRQPYAPLSWKVRDMLRFALKSLWLLLFSQRRAAYWHNIRQGVRDARLLE